VTVPLSWDHAEKSRVTITGEPELRNRGRLRGGGGDVKKMSGKLGEDALGGVIGAWGIYRGGKDKIRGGGRGVFKGLPPRVVGLVWLQGDLTKCDWPKKRGEIWSEESGGQAEKT